MAFQFAYSLDGDGANVVKDYALDTAGTYGTGGMKKGDLVYLNLGLVRKVQAATAANSSIGVVEGGEFTGLVAQGQPYAAVNSSFIASAINTTKNPNGVTKVRADKTAAVYKVPVKTTQTATNANIGVAYGIYLDANNDQSVDLTVTATAQCKVLDYTPDGKYVFVTLT